MLVKELITFLQEQNPEATVILSSDAEGNKYSPLDSLESTKAIETSSWEVELMHPDDIIDGYYNNEDLNKAFDALGLFPIN